MDKRIKGVSRIVFNVLLCMVMRPRRGLGCNATATRKSKSGEHDFHALNLRYQKHEDLGHCFEQLG
jgi:hypothetical protein